MAEHPGEDANNLLASPAKLRLGKLDDDVRE
jgi:hypothetical protein